MQETNDSRKTTSQKRHGSVSLMAHVLETCDRDTYTIVEGQPEWENAMVEGYNSLMKNETWDLVP